MSTNPHIFIYGTQIYLKTKFRKMTQSDKEEVRESLLDKYVFMDKTFGILEVGLKTEKNIVLYGPGGHGKSEYSLEYFYERGINPYIITMGTGMTTDRLFGGLDIPLLETGKIEYLVENSFMNHEYVIFEELMDAPDFILEQLKDILSSGVFRNGTQVFPIKTRFIVGCTNKTRDEFSKNASLKALMERFPLENNVIWDNYNEASYNTLLERRFGEGAVDPIIPFLLQEYCKSGIIISPRIALDCYEIYEECGPDALLYIAEFARKPGIIKDALKKFEATVKFKQIGAEIEDLVNTLKGNPNKTVEEKRVFVSDYNILTNKFSEVRSMVVNDDLIQVHAAITKKTNEEIQHMAGRYRYSMESINKADNGEVIEEIDAEYAKEKEAPRRKSRYGYDQRGTPEPARQTAQVEIDANVADVLKSIEKRKLNKGKSLH